MPEEKKEKGLTITTVWLMIATALFFDTLQALLVPVGIGFFVPIISYPTFWLWFKMRGMNFFSLKRAPTLGIGAFIEMIPGLDLLPAFTFTVARIALTNKLQSIVPGQGITKLGISQVSNWAKQQKDHAFDPKNNYRVVGTDGYKDFRDNGVVKSSPTGTPPKQVGKFNIGNRYTPFPSFAKGEPDLSYGGNSEEKYIFESDRPMYGRGDTNPVTGNTIRSRHYAARPIDEKTGRVIEEMKPDMIKDVYRKDKDGNLWKRGKLN